jgi:hypothetical protein
MEDDWPDWTTSELEHAEMKQRKYFIYVSAPWSKVANKFFQRVSADPLPPFFEAARLSVWCIARPSDVLEGLGMDACALLE